MHKLNTVIQKVFVDLFYLKEFWSYALENYQVDNDYIEFDITAYFNLLYEEIYAFEGDAFQYGGDDCQSGQNSVYFIFFAEDPSTTIQRFNAFIIDELKK